MLGLGIVLARRVFAPLFFESEPMFFRPDGKRKAAVTDPSGAEVGRSLAPHIDRGSDRPLSRQIADRLWVEVISGVLETGVRLPTVRQLAVDLGTHPMTVQRAYDELERLGVVTVRPGGTYVSLTIPDAGVRERLNRLEQAGREALREAAALGFSPDDLIDMLQELRAARRDMTNSK